MIGWDLQAIFSHASTQKCRFMGKEVHEISRFFVASPHELALSFWRISRTSLPKHLHPLVLYNRFDIHSFPGNNDPCCQVSMFNCCFPDELIKNRIVELKGRPTSSHSKRGETMQNYR